jgi:hypothetical protein
MRLFQNGGVYQSYLVRLNQLARKASSFADRRQIFLADRFGALHFLKPVLDGDRDAFFTNGDDEILQRQWARENGMKGRPPLEDILLAQIEHHRAEVFYNLDPMRYPGSFVRKLPGSIKRTICWRAAPSGNANLAAYHAVVSNFPSILESWRKRGCRAELFFPAIDPKMAEFGHGERPIDVLFVGGYSRHHSVRAKILESVAQLADNCKIVYHLDTSRLTRLAESFIGRVLPLQKHSRPAAITRIAKPPVFGRELYELIGRSKIVLNGAVDMAGADRGNMRCFEAIGCGALLLSDMGNYPEGMRNGETMLTYDGVTSCVEQIKRCLGDWGRIQGIADVARLRVGELYSKKRQWHSFQAILARL